MRDGSGDGGVRVGVKGGSGDGVRGKKWTMLTLWFHMPCFSPG